MPASRNPAPPHTEVKLKPWSKFESNAMSKLFSQRERSSSSNQFKTKTEAMCDRQPSFASAPANAVDPNHPRNGEEVPAEVEVPDKTASIDPRNCHGDANSSHGPNPRLSPIGSNHDPCSHHTLLWAIQMWMLAGCSPPSLGLRRKGALRPTTRIYGVPLNDP